MSEVILLVRGEELSGQETYRRRVLEHPKIHVRHHTVVEEILGAQAVTGARIRDLASDAADDLELGAVFVYVGLQPNTEVVDGLLDVDEDARVPTDAAMRTELQGVLAAGIGRSGAAGRAAGSAGDGAAAAIAADRYLADGSWAGQIAVSFRTGGTSG